LVTRLVVNLVPVRTLMVTWADHVKAVINHEGARVGLSARLFAIDSVLNDEKATVMVT
jgi:hypothetical protein